ncbi:hypothetical protein K491DRAFT_696491 [Lophiostoma macrostomum CBS 122681]|uniref:Uncharacterized protein n=1 Tax=Lophiostoma macrostomum CBS 122681 TaxID=1314788 RepID=A0A6A6SY76_9PLEO|nr:hypothetical protein K491DRAFT_696491 [Lophiostoma macrostomum CBS 122681]
MNTDAALRLPAGDDVQASVRAKFVSDDGGLSIFTVPSDTHAFRVDLRDFNGTTVF